VVILPEQAVFVLLFHGTIPIIPVLERDVGLTLLGFNRQADSDSDPVCEAHRKLQAVQAVDT
jgi:hypothetical protein